MISQQNLHENDSAKTEKTLSNHLHQTVQEEQDEQNNDANTKLEEPYGIEVQETELKDLESQNHGSNANIVKSIQTHVEQTQQQEQQSPITVRKTNPERSYDAYFEYDQEREVLFNNANNIPRESIDTYDKGTLQQERETLTEIANTKPTESNDKLFEKAADEKKGNIAEDGKTNFEDIYVKETPLEKQESPSVAKNTTCLLSENKHIDQRVQQEQENDFVPELFARRWFVLLGYCILTISTTSNCFAFSAISNITRKYYKIDTVSVNWLAMVFPVVSMILMFPSNHFLEKKGLALTTVLASFFNGIGSCIKYIGFSIDPFGYWFLLIGNILSGISVSVCIFLPSKIAAVWFGERERATATSLAIGATSLGFALGYLLPTAMIKNWSQLEKIGNDFGNYLLAMAISSCFAFIYMALVVKDRPKTPPSYNEFLKQKPKAGSHQNATTNSYETLHLRGLNSSSSITSTPERRISIKEEVKLMKVFLGYEKLLKNKHFHIILQLHGIILALENVFLIALNEMLIPRFPGHELEIGVMGAAGLIISIPSSFLVGILLDKTGAFKKVTIATTLLTSLLTGLWIMLFYLKSPFYSLFCTYVATVTVYASYYTTAFDHCAELTYPVSESRSGAILLWLGQVYSFVFTRMASFVLIRFNAQVLLICIQCFYILTFVLSLIVKGKGPRSLFVSSALTVVSS